MASTRQRRVGELLKEEISRIVQQEVSDPRVGFATITDVDVTPDLREAHVYVSILGEPDQQAQGLKALQRAAGFIRRQLGQRVELRATPELTFGLDQSAERATRVLKLFDELEKEKKA